MFLCTFLLLFFFSQLNVDLRWSLQSYLVILVLDSKALSQVSEHLWTVLFEFELSRKILPEEQRSFNTYIIQI